MDFSLADCWAIIMIWYISVMHVPTYLTVNAATWCLYTFDADAIYDLPANKPVHVLKRRKVCFVKRYCLITQNLVTQLL